MIYYDIWQRGKTHGSTSRYVFLSYSLALAFGEMVHYFLLTPTLPIQPLETGKLDHSLDKYEWRANERPDPEQSEGPP